MKKHARFKFFFLQFNIYLHNNINRNHPGCCWTFSWNETCKVPKPLQVCALYYIGNSYFCSRWKRCSSKI